MTTPATWSPSHATHNSDGSTSGPWNQDWKSDSSGGRWPQWSSNASLSAWKIARYWSGRDRPHPTPPGRRWRGSAPVRYRRISKPYRMVHEPLVGELRPPTLHRSMAKDRISRGPGRGSAAHSATQAFPVGGRNSVVPMPRRRYSGTTSPQVSAISVSSRTTR